MTAIEKVKVIINTQKIYNVFVNLWYRWQDEGKYEDIKDYGVAIVKAMNDEFSDYGIKLVSATKRPFGVKVEIDGEIWHFVVKISGRYLKFSVSRLGK